jgi:hypothetical protein
MRRSQGFEPIQAGTPQRNFIDRYLGPQPNQLPATVPDQDWCPRVNTEDTYWRDGAPRP